MTEQRDTEPEVDLELEDRARRAAVRKWNALHPAEQAAVMFDDLVARERRRLARKKGDRP